MEKRTALNLAGLLSLLFALALTRPAAAQPSGPVCFWSAQGVTCVERPTADDPSARLSALLAGPSVAERARGLDSALPPGAELAGVGAQPDGRFVVRLRLPADMLHRLDHATHEAIVEQIGWTLHPFGWTELRLEVWHPDAGRFVPLANFLPQVPRIYKEAIAPPPPAVPSATMGGLSGKEIYISAGHGWQWNSNVNRWRTQRPPYPNAPYPAPLIEDHNNAEAVNQYLLQYLENAGAQVFPIRERDMNTGAAIVDNDAPAPGVYSESGLWTTTSAAGTGYAGSDYRWAATVVGAPTAAATWSFTLPADGRYAVYVWYRQGSNRAADARYTIHHAGGESVMYVDQRTHGDTWRYIGAYGFRAGETASVTLDNLSAQAGVVVIADAVRIGGGVFDSLSGLSSGGAPYPPNKPWWETAAYYQTQRMGMDPGDWPYFNDIVARPMYARWEHACGGGNAVYVSWHSNGISGYQTSTRGTLGIIHDGSGNPVTPGSAALRDAVQAELVADIRAGWDATWPEYKRSMNLGELRELWDDDPACALPGALIEVAYHDHPSDADALRDPRFNRLAARAIYQGIVKYFEQRDGVDLTLLPEPPTHLAAQNAGDGRVRVSWRPAPVDALGLGGDAATGYRVYTSADGIGWADGLPTAATAYTLTGLAEGQLLFVRVTATNAGGESLPSETLAARVGDAPAILLVSGFDRLDHAMDIPETDPVEGYNHRMLLDRMNRYDYAIQHGAAIPHPFDGASNEAARDGAVDLRAYRLVDWFVGEESTGDETLDATERALLADFMERGGALFLSGTEIGWHLDYLSADPDFYNQVLRADYAGDDAATYAVAPAPGSIFGGLPAFRFDAPGGYDADYPDQLSPLNGAAAALTYEGGPGGVAAVEYADGDGCGRLVYFGFPFETIWPEQRPAVMGRVLDFLGRCAFAPETWIVAPADGSAHRVTPEFSGRATFGAPALLDRVEAQVYRAADGLYWAGGAWMGAPTWVTTTGVISWSYPLPELADGGYTLRARAWTADGRVDGSPAEATFIYDTRPPTATTLITPLGTLRLATLGVTLAWEPVAPDGGSSLAYTVLLDGRLYTTTESVYTIVPVASGPHDWGVQVFDAAGNRSPWALGAFTIERYEIWLPCVIRDT